MCVYEFVTFFVATSHKSGVEWAFLSGQIYENTKVGLESYALQGKCY